MFGGEESVFIDVVYFDEVYFNAVSKVSIHLPGGCRSVSYYDIIW